VATVINTRPADQNGELSDLLRRAGFEVLEIPMVDIVPDEEGLARLRKLQPSGFNGVFLSSPNGLRQMASGLPAAELEPWMEKPFFLVGGKSSTLVRNHGGKVAFYPEEASLEGFLKEYTPAAAANAGVKPGPGGLVLAQRWLHPCSASTRLDPAAFREKGIGVENVPLYKPAMAADAGERLMAEGRGADAVVFCSASAVAHFFRAAPELAARIGKAGGPLPISIGPSTSNALAGLDVEKCFEAAHADNPGLVDALKDAFGGAATKVLKKSPAKTDPEKKA
jgi:uroporphyrinogen-III synthase